MGEYAPDPEKAKLVALNFALKLETACREFEALQVLLIGTVRLEAADQFEQMRISATIRMALVHAFLFNTVRAYRICEHGKSLLRIDRDHRKRFLKAIEPVVDVRDVNEHGFDAHEVPGKKNDRPKMHAHEDLSALVDETSIVINGPDRIAMGPLNLFDVYRVVAEMRDVAGFRSLPDDPPRLPPSA